MAEGLSAEDKLMIRTLEVEAYRIQAQMVDIRNAMQSATDALNYGVKSLAEKYDKNLEEYRLDLKTLEFVPVPTQPAQPVSAQLRQETPHD